MAGGLRKKQRPGLATNLPESPFPFVGLCFSFVTLRTAFCKSTCLSLELDKVGTGGPWGLSLMRMDLLYWWFEEPELQSLHIQ